MNDETKGNTLAPAPASSATETARRIDGSRAPVVRGLVERSEVCLQLGATLVLALHELACFARRHGVGAIESEARQAIEELGQVGLPTVLVAPKSEPSEDELLH